MEPYGYREVLETVLEFTSGRQMISLKEAKLYLGYSDDRAVKRRCPHFASGKVPAAIFAKDLCKYSEAKKRGRRAI